MCLKAQIENQWSIQPISFYNEEAEPLEVNLIAHAIVTTVIDGKTGIRTQVYWFLFSIPKCSLKNQFKNIW